MRKISKIYIFSKIFDMTEIKSDWIPDVDYAFFCYLRKCYKVPIWSQIINLFWFACGSRWIQPTLIPSGITFSPDTRLAYFLYLLKKIILHRWIYSLLNFIIWIQYSGLPQIVPLYIAYILQPFLTTFFQYKTQITPVFWKVRAICCNPLYLIQYYTGKKYSCSQNSLFK